MLECRQVDAESCASLVAVLPPLSQQAPQVRAEPPGAIYHLGLWVGGSIRVLLFDLRERRPPRLLYALGQLGATIGIRSQMMDQLLTIQQLSHDQCQATWKGVSGSNAGTGFVPSNVSCAPEQDQ